LLGRALLGVCVATAAVTLFGPAGAGAAAAPADRALGPSTRFFVPPPNRGAVQQAVDLLRARRLHDALLLAKMVTTGQAVWFTSGTPADVKKQVRRTMFEAALQRSVPVLVAYYVPYRDCAQYSAGGATDTAAYKQWIDGFAAGIGSGKAVVLLEPDSLGIIPWNIDINGNAEWCKPTVDGAPAPEADPAHRYEQLNFAVDRLEQQPNASVYLDGTHSGWLGVGDVADRLVKAGVQHAQGVYLNVSNYQLTPQLIKYGTWIAGCIAFANNADEGGWRLGHYSWCGSQYYPASPNDFSTWGLTDAWYAANLGTAIPSTHFVVDTSRNGRGPTDMSVYGAAPYNQPAGVVATLQGGNWCNPPGAGLGLRPTAATGVPLLDAYLWAKVPGESDGQCNAAGGARAWDYTAYSAAGWPTDAAQRALFDPLWGLFDPAAGSWFPQQALQLAQNAVPALR
jgi:endoglucanase